MRYRPCIRCYRPVLTIWWDICLRCRIKDRVADELFEQVQAEKEEV